MEAWGHSEVGRKVREAVFFHGFRLKETSTGLRIAPKSLSLVGTVPTELPVKEFLKKNNPVLDHEALRLSKRVETVNNC